MDTPVTACYHCGQPTNPNMPLSATVLGQPRPMCCPGCQAVAQAITANGLEDYYQFRTQPADPASPADAALMARLAVYDDPQVQSEFVISDGPSAEIQLTLEGISCAACGWLIEKQLTRMTGVQQVAVNVSQRRAWIRWQAQALNLSQILQELQRIGYQGYPFQPDKHEAAFAAEHKRYLKKLGLAGLMTMQVMMLMAATYFDPLDNMTDQMQGYLHWISLVLTTPVVFYAGSVFYTGALRALSARQVNMDVPISLAIGLTYTGGAYATVSGQGPVYFESICMFIFLLLLSRFAEHRSRQHAMHTSANMLKYIPVTATVVDGDTLHAVPARQLVCGQRVRVRAGETIPVDGHIVTGSAEVNESMLTGEFAPVAKQAGDAVFGGSVCIDNRLDIEVGQPLKHSLVSQIVQLQAKAMANRPRLAQQADQLAQYFVCAVLVLAACTFSYWHWACQPDAIWIAVAVLVATCPCALGLATPTALSCAMSSLNRLGVLIKQADVLETLTRCQRLVLDKTGTLTEGRYSIEQHWLAPKADPSHIAQLAASLEAGSEHPIAAVFTASSLLPVDDFCVHPGQGVAGTIDGKAYRMGTPAFAGVYQATPFEPSVVLSCDGTPLAAWLLQDSLKDGVAEVLGTTSPLHLTILSGDTHASVQHIARQLHIDDFFSRHTPAQKLTRVSQWQAERQRLIMVGDGINDAPVMAQADVAISVGNATDIARSAADIVLLTPSLRALPVLLRQAQRTTAIIRQNLGWALGYNALVLPLAMTGMLSPWMAVLGMSFSSIIVVVNSSRLQRP